MVIAVKAMSANLVAGRPDDYSETARPRPRHRETGGHSPARREPAILGRGLADDVTERAAERPEAGEADVETDVGHAAPRLPQQKHGALHSSALQVAMRCLAKRRTEGADEVRLGHQGHSGERRNIEWLSIRPIHR